MAMSPYFSGILFSCSKKGPLKVPMGVNFTRTPTADLINLPDLSPGWNTIADHPHIHRGSIHRNSQMEREKIDYTDGAQ